MRGKGGWDSGEGLSSARGQPGWAGTRRMTSNALLRCPVDGCHDGEDRWASSHSHVP